MLHIYYGNTNDFMIEALDYEDLDLNGNPTPLDLTGCDVWWTMKQQLADPDSEALILHHWSQAGDEGLSLIDPDSGVPLLVTGGQLWNTVTPAETETLEEHVRYRYDVKLKNSAGRLRTIEFGYAILRNVVNQESA